MSCDHDPCDKKVRCESCRTINLAKPSDHPKANMEMYDKCKQTRRLDCSSQVPELHVHPTCIKVCSKEEYRPPRIPRAPQGKMMFVLKTGILASTAYFTYNQGVWGDQAQTSECWKRWQEYIKALNTRRPPTFDDCGNVIKTQGSAGSIIAPAYDVYKDILTSCFSGVVKIPLVIKCAYIDYLNALERKKDELAKERAIRRKG